MALSKYNKDRPFLMVKLIRMAPKKAPTHLKNYSETGQWQLGEQITIEDCVKSRHLSESAMIVDILKAKMIKNRSERSDADALQYLLTKYKKEITEGIEIWMRRSGMNITPQQMQKIEKNAHVPNIIEQTLAEGDSENIADMIKGTTVEEVLEATVPIEEVLETEEPVKKPKRSRKKNVETEKDEHDA
ncbi:MAG: hypothetical protein HC836_25850 [Richelia sp. RM2_1_2]|nr:hypothetical protein [Richelia sp. RM2_1_2]